MSTSFGQLASSISDCFSQISAVQGLSQDTNPQMASIDSLATSLLPEDWQLPVDLSGYANFLQSQLTRLLAMPEANDPIGVAYVTATMQLPEANTLQARITAHCAELTTALATARQVVSDISGLEFTANAALPGLESKAATAQAQMDSAETEMKQTRLAALVGVDPFNALSESQSAQAAYDTASNQLTGLQAQITQLKSELPVLQNMGSLCQSLVTDIGDLLSLCEGLNSTVSALQSNLSQVQDSGPSAPDTPSALAPLQAALANVTALNSALS